jgi:glycosyltransferase involved in cell wall biosynthesis
MRRPDWQFVFVGNKVQYVEPRSEQEYLACRRLQNVHFLGYKRHVEVPQYVLGMDVNIMCYRMSDETWIKANSPLKLHEYFAAGRPIVAADLPSVQPFLDILSVARDVDGWQVAIEEALATGGRGTPERRKAIAAENSWDARAQLLEHWLMNLDQRRG